jgi:hypothetical protein
MTELERSHLDLRPALRLAGKEIVRFQFEWCPAVVLVLCRTGRPMQFANTSSMPIYICMLPTRIINAAQAAIGIPCVTAENAKQPPARQMCVAGIFSNFPCFAPPPLCGRNTARLNRSAGAYTSDFRPSQSVCPTRIQQARTVSSIASSNRPKKALNHPIGTSYDVLSTTIWFLSSVRQFEGNACVKTVLKPL